MPYPHTAKYQQFHHEVYNGLAEAPASWPSPLSELDLQSLWFAGELGSHFETTDGKRVNIRDFGIWNHAAGPDFAQTCIHLDGRVLHGDIEIDPDARDWERHGHGANPNYNRVILHLFTQAPEPRFYTRTSEHHEIAQVHLRPEMLAANATPKRQAEARLGRCATPLASMPEDRVNDLLQSAAQYRMQKKSARLQTLTAIHGREQTLYQSLAAALGYRPNQRAFTILAQRLPLKELLKKSQLEREALLFGVAGFLEPIKDEDTTPDTRTYLRSLWSEWWKRRHGYEVWLHPSHLPPWQTGSTRPGNHPQRRLGCLSSLLNSWKTISPLFHHQDWNRRKFIDALSSIEHTYWNQHYTLLAAPAKAPIALLGNTRIHEIEANIVYPLLVPEQESLWEEYLKIKSVLDNQKVRRSALRLFGEDTKSKKFQSYLYQQQGLLQLYDDYCLEDDSSCADCPFPERLRDWR